MPFGKYKDFDDCVRQNSNKDDPNAYCAVIQRQIEGKHKLGQMWAAHKQKSAKHESTKKLRIAELLKQTPNPTKEKMAEWSEMHGIDAKETDSIIHELAAERARQTKLTIPAAMSEQAKKIGAEWKKATMENISQVELEKGMRVEREHTDNEDAQRKIALDHLRENPNYYTEMEKCMRSKQAETKEYVNATSFNTEDFINEFNKQKKAHPDYNDVYVMREAFAATDKRIEEERKRAGKSALASTPTIGHGMYGGTYSLPLEKPKMTKAELGKAWAEHKGAEHSGVGQVPADYGKWLDKGEKKMETKHFKKLTHGEKHVYKKARHWLGMKEYAEMDVAFLTEGKYTATDGEEYFYPWDVIERDAKTFVGREYFIDHSEKNGTEVGIITETYPEEIDGQEWLCATVRIPEAEFTQAYLSRLENGLIQEFSSTHDFIVEPTDKKKVVKAIQGDSLSSVRDGEVPNTKVLRLVRHIRNKDWIKNVQLRIGEEWKNRTG